MEFFDFVLAGIGSFLVRGINKLFRTKFQFGYGGLQVAGVISVLIAVFLLIKIVFL